MNKQKELLQWPRTLIIFMGLITLVSFFNLVFFIYRKSLVDLDVSFTALLRDISTFDYIIFTCFIIFISTYFFIRHPKLLAGFSSFKWNKKTLDIKKFNDLSKKLKAGEKERLFLDTELTESGLAEKLGVKSYLLSKFLNERLGKTFNQFINENRIDEARKMLEKKENEDLTMFAIAVDSGFKSESSFYSNFKKYTGMTPKQYKTKFMNS